MQVELLNNPAGTPFSSGGFADVFKSELQGLAIAVKVLRTYSNSNLQKTARVSYH